MKSIFKNDELKRLLPVFFFFLIYTFLFAFWVQTFYYTLPFLLGLLLAILVQPIISFFDNRLKLNHTLSSAIVVFATLALVFAALFFLGLFAVSEITEFILNVTSGNFPELSEPITNFLNEAGNLFGGLGESLFEKNRDELLQLLQNSMNLIVTFLGTVLNIITSLPTIITMVIVVVFSTFFIARDLKKLQSWAKGILSDRLVFHVKSAQKHTKSDGRKFLLSYLLIYFITFCDTFVIMSVFGVSYPLTISLVTAVADFLPILGPGIVFTPLAIYQLLIGNYPCAAGIMIGWLVVTCIRQVVEPRLVSSTTKVHPLAMMAAIYFSLVAGSIWVLFYVMGFFMLYSAFQFTGALPEFVRHPRKESRNEES